MLVTSYVMLANFKICTKHQLIPSHIHYITRHLSQYTTPNQPDYTLEQLQDVSQAASEAISS